MPFVTHLECPKCQTTLDTNALHNLCPCGSPLLVRYDLEALAESITRDDLINERNDMWRYRAFLPVPDDAIVTLGEGMTPMLKAERLGARLGVGELLIKDEGANPTGSFKARGAAAGISMARVLGASTVAMPTAGNAGGAWSAYAAKAAIDCYIAMPEDAPVITQKECDLFGAHTYLVRGLISDAGAIIGRGVKRYGWYDVSTLKEPYRIEGKKTMGIELLEQLDWQMPDAILYPAGGGVGLIGIWKAFEELEAIGWIGSERPKMIAVQSEGCAPLVQAFEAGKMESEFWEGAETLAAGIRVPKALGDFLVLEAIYASDGCAIAVSDAEIMSALRRVSEDEGMWICPEGAATVAALEQLVADGFLGASDNVLIMNTGSGLKYSSVVDIDLPVLDIDEDIEI